MRRTTSRLVWFAIAIFVASRPCDALAQFRSPVFLVDQFPQPGGDNIYRLTTTALGHQFYGVPLDALTFTRPDGTILPRSSETDYASFNDLAAHLFGDWIVTEDPTTGPNNTYTVRIAPFTLSNVNANVPVITSPLPGERVPTEFIVKWQLSGPRNSRGLFHLHPGATVDIDPTVDSMSSWGVQAELLQPAPVPFLISVSGSTDRPAPTVHNRSPAVLREEIRPVLRFESNSLPVNFFVVPEPSAFVLAPLAMTFIGFFRSRRRNRRD